MFKLEMSDFKQYKPMLYRCQNQMIHDLTMGAWTVYKVKARKSESNPGYSWVYNEVLSKQLVPNKYWICPGTFPEHHNPPNPKKVNVGVQGETKVSVYAIPHLGGIRKAPKH